MRKRLTTILITSLIMVLALGGVCFFVYRQNKKLQNAQKELKQQELDIFLDNSEKQVFDERQITATSLDTKPKKAKTIYSRSYTEAKNAYIKKCKKKNLYDFDSPLMEWNLYGTNNLSMYLYFKASEDTYIRYTIQVEDDRIPNFTRTLYNGEANNLTREHEYQITGFVPGMKNLLILDMYGKDDKLRNQKVFEINVPALQSGAETKLSVSSGRSEEQISNGLYTVFGQQSILLYDNSGVLRGEIPYNHVSSQKLFIEENKMYYGIDANHVVAIGPLGQVEKVYTLGKYSQYEDFIYNGYGDLWILATEKGKKSKSVKDTVISLNLQNGDIKELFSMETLLPKMMKTAKKTKKQKELNWIDLNSLTQVNSDEILVSSRELSSIFKVININSRSPRITFIIGESKVWKGSGYEKKLLAKAGQAEANQAQADAQANSLVDLGSAAEVFYAPFGQTCIQQESSDKLSDGQYYLYVWNSNYGYSATRPKVKWTGFKGVGTKQREAKCSYVEKYLIDETTAQYNQEENKQVAYTPKNGSMQFYGTQSIYNFGSAKEYAEYDKKGKLIRKFSHSIPNVSNVEKQDFKGFWFQ